MFITDLNPDYMDFGRGGLSAAAAAARAKRMRTSFKHHQLRTMKSYFAINHNPDAKDLKQLSQKTGLPKRVLQVSVPKLSHYFLLSFSVLYAHISHHIASFKNGIQMHL